jgi:hypothetical protein
VKIRDKAPGHCVFKLTSPYTGSVKIGVDTEEELNKWVGAIEHWYVWGRRK